MKGLSLDCSATAPALDPEVKALLDEINALPTVSAGRVSVEQARLDALAQNAVLAAPGPAVGRVYGLDVPGPWRGIPVRVYRPMGVAPHEVLPVYVNFHGSGFVVCSIDTHDHICRILCQQARCMVVAVDYCKAPEYKFPKPVEEAWAATQWVCTHATSLGGDARRVAVGGDSAGGCLAAVVAQRALAEGAPRLVHQLLVYPVTDTDVDTPSYRNFAEGFRLTAKQMQWFFDCYFSEEQDRRDVRAAPLRAADLRGLPAATVILAGHDPLFSEGCAYAQRLAQAGVPTQVFNHGGGIHGFWSATARIPTLSRLAHRQAAQALQQAFSRPLRGVAR